MPSSSKLNFELQSLLTCFFGPTKFVASFNADWQATGAIGQWIHSGAIAFDWCSFKWGLANLSTTLTDPLDACAGYGIIDIERLDCAFFWMQTSINSFVDRVCACLHLAKGIERHNQSGIALFSLGPWRSWAPKQTISWIQERSWTFYALFFWDYWIPATWMPLVNVVLFILQDMS